MEGEGDGFRSERWSMREKMEGDRALGFKMCLRKTHTQKKKKKKKRRDCPTKCLGQTSYGRVY